MTEIRAGWTQVANGELQIDAYLAEPTTSGTFPGVVVIQEIFGVNSHMREVTERIAREGYVAIAPAIYQRTAPGFDVGYSEADLVEGRKHKDLTTADQLLSDVQAAIDFLKTKPNVKPNFGIVGFCYGGHVAYLAATLTDAKATASFYGGGIATMTPGGGEPTINRTPDIKGTLYAFFGLSDVLIPNNEADQIEAALQQHAITHKVFRYPAGHGFFCDQRADYNPAAAADSWEQVKQLFQGLKE